MFIPSPLPGRRLTNPRLLEYRDWCAAHLVGTFGSNLDEVKVRACRGANSPRPLQPEGVEPQSGDCSSTTSGSSLLNGKTTTLMCDRDLSLLGSTLGYVEKMIGRVLGNAGRYALSNSGSASVLESLCNSTTWLPWSGCFPLARWFVFTDPSAR